MDIPFSTACRAVLSSQKGRTSFEAVLTAILIAIFIFIAVDRFYLSVKTVKETAMTVEMANLRSSINYYVMFDGKLPISLKEMIERSMEASRGGISGADYNIVIAGKYVESMALDSEGYPLDPFGNRYSYNSGTGRVNSSTKGYEQW